MDTGQKYSRKNPKATANFLSTFFFGWLFPLFWKGARRDLELTDLFDPLKSDESETLGDRLEREWETELKKAEEEVKLGKDGITKPRKKPNLTWAIARAFWVPFFVQGVFLLIQTSALKIMQPILQGWIIGYFTPDQTQTTKNEVLIYAGLLVGTTLGVVFIMHHTNQRLQHIGMCIRVACCTMIYRKVLRIDQAALNNTAAGQVANLISNDVARFDMVLMFLHYVWIMPIQVTVIGFVMWDYVGIAALVGIGAMLVMTLPVQATLSKVSAKLRSKTAVRTDQRVQMMSELISGIQVVKMYSWEKPFEIMVSGIRAIEIKFIRYISYIRGMNQGAAVFSERLTLYLTLITYVLMGNSLHAEVTFVPSTLFNVLQATCAIFLPIGVVMAGETVVSLRRLTNFLLLDEYKSVKKDQPRTEEEFASQKEKRTAPRIESGIEIAMFNIAANWVHGQLPPTLCQLSLKVKGQSLCAVVGPVGSGKSSLLHLLLGELPVGAGRLSFFTGGDNPTNIAGEDIRISYASQDPWLFSASVRHNILFGLPYDEARYREVTRVCALRKDFEELPQGDLSFVGERGASLSGGQRARVNLARAVYRDADLYLLDDPLSAVDPRVGRHLFEECICGFLKDKTRILVTHQLQYLRQADTVVVLDRGTMECQGPFEELERTNPKVLLSRKSQENEESKDSNENPETKMKFRKSITPSINNDSSLEAVADKEAGTDVVAEEMERGAMSNKVYTSYFRAGGHLCMLACVTTIFIIGQVSSSGTDYWLTYWTNQETLRDVATSLDTEVVEEETGTLQWLDKYGLVRQNEAIYVYTGCIIACVVFNSMRSLLFMRICMNASRNIHNSMFDNLLQATMRFFNTNPTGRILNRFSKDVGTMDELLPKSLLATCEILTVMTGIMTMVALANPWMLIPMVVMLVAFWIIRIYFIRTAQNLKRLEGVAKSPVFSHVSSTLDGLTTIRSRGADAEGLLRKEFDEHQDVHTGAWYMTIATANAFGLLLDLISTAFIACVCFSFILLDDGNTLGGSVGLAISQSLILTGMVQYGIRQSTEVIAYMTSVERVLQYTNLPKEGPFTTPNPPPTTWPWKGALTFENVTMRYAENKPPVLKGLNVNIKPGWKVGIVGRTGAGKSSLISALFRLTGDGLEGEIVLDGIDTGSIGLHELRPRISIIPQEPILFSASLRHNLDPFNDYEDARLWDSLREVELGDAVPSLDFLVAGGGANFSVGQRQLICLARAILRNNRVLVLDEATANVDPKTDALIQKTIRRRFADCTVLTIAHRLNTIMDSDRVMVMAAGRIVEFDHPHLLLKNDDGHFSRMVEQTGSVMARKLAAIAERAFHQNHEFLQEFNDEEDSLIQDNVTTL